MPKHFNKCKSKISIALAMSLVLSQVQMLNVNALEKSKTQDNKSCVNKIDCKEDIEYKKTVILDIKYDKSKSSEVINIPDVNLKRAINQALGKNEYDNITKLELESIQSLGLYDEDIESLEGIQYCINLVGLYVDDAKISNINQLKDLINLESLTLVCNEISNIDALQNLTKLKDLVLYGNKISNIDSLKNLVNLENLSLAQNKITDIRALNNLVNLKILNLGSNEIKEVNLSSKLKKLESLYIRNNKITNLELEGLHKLKYLDIIENNLINVSLKDLLSLEQIEFDEYNNPDYTDNKFIETVEMSNLPLLRRIDLRSHNISSIKLHGLTNLYTLLLSNNNIGDISGLSNLTKLETLYLDNNNITDISELSSLKNLSELNLSDNKISDINTLSKLLNLRMLWLNNNKINNISSLSELVNLLILELNNNSISDISELSKLTQVYNLQLSNNNISNISILSNLKDLGQLELNNNKISDISVLSNLNNLYTLRLGNNNISDISSISNAPRLNVLDLSNNNIKDISVFSKINKMNELYLSDNKIKDITPLQNIRMNLEFGDIGYIDLNRNYLNLNDNNTIKVIETLKNRWYDIDFENQLEPIESDKVFVNFAVDSINNKSNILTGNGEPGAKVEAYIGTTKIGTTTVDSSGQFRLSITPRSTNTKIRLVISKDGYENIEKTIIVLGTATKSTKSLTTDIYKYDIGKGKYLTYINNKGYSQYSYLNKSGKYAFTPSSWMTAAGLSVSMPTSTNGYTMMIDNNYIEMKSNATTLLNNIKSNKIAKSDIQKSLNYIENMSTKSTNIATTKAAPKKSLTKDIYKYDAGKGKYLTYINGKGYSQYSYLNTSGTYAFTPSSWMKAAGLTVTMPTSSNGYTMKITNQYKLDYEKIVKEIQNYM